MILWESHEWEKHVTKTKVYLSQKAQKQLKKMPRPILVKLMGWTHSVETDGLMATRKVPGYHDEPLKGKRQGQRSIRLSKAYRAIYELDDRGNPWIALVCEVNKHDY